MKKMFIILLLLFQIIYFYSKEVIIKVIDSELNIPLEEVRISVSKINL